MSLVNAIQGMTAGLQQSQAPQHIKPNRAVNPAELAEIRNERGRFTQQARELNEAVAVREAPQISRPTFSQLVERAVDHVDAKQDYAGDRVRAIMTGESDNLHEATIAMEEAGVAFNLMMETRNKLMESYQQLMRLRV